MLCRGQSERSLFGATLLFAVLGLSSAAGADTPMTVKQLQRMHFPQPVRVGSLAGDEVIKAGKSLRKFGEVVGIFQPNAGEMQMVFRYGGMLGMGGRLIAPSLHQVTLVGQMVKINHMDNKDLTAMPTFTGSGGRLLGPNEVIRMGVGRKF